VNLNLAPAIFSSGTNVQKALELFAEAGIQCLSAHVMQDLVDKVKKSISDLSEEQL
jgi:geranylgeranyl pyrophosphate synthase